ncbi:MAG TPA: ATP-dependent DNA ligase, partial [Actinomycetota bacterium]|nr:ATP-dependent DNA ligase [Actinomycetota bacterium]
MLLAEIAATSAAVAGTPARLAKIEQLAACLRRLTPAEVPVAVAYLSGELPRGALGVGWASLRGVPPPAEPPATDELLDADAALARVQAATGAGSQGRRRSELAGLFARLT